METIKTVKTIKKLLICGAGNMGYAIANGLIQNKLYSKENIIFLEKSKEKVKALKKNKFYVYTGTNEIFNNYKNEIEIIILAVKPNDVFNLLNDLKKRVLKNTIIVSICAGIKIKTIQPYFSSSQPIVRVMPNTPCQIGEGISVLTFTPMVSKNLKERIKKIFSSLGNILELNENKFDLVTAISGSGPAYFCYLIENMAEAGRKNGLSKNDAMFLSTLTAQGTAKLLTLKKIDPTDLRKMVTSPNGTTEAAIKTFDKFNAGKIIQHAIKAAKDRSVELGRDGNKKHKK